MTAKLFTPLYQTGNPCEGCKDYCISCLRRGVQKTKAPYSKPIRSDKMEHYNTYLRWLQRNEAGVVKFVRRHYEQADHEAEYEWLLDHPKVAYQLINSYETRNNVKLAQILSKTIDEENFYTSCMWIGRPGGGKTWGSLWASENCYKEYPEKSYQYLTYTKRITLPEWMEPITSIPEIRNDCFLIVDEGGIQAPARRSMKQENVTLGQLLNIRRHKDLQIHFIVQEPEDIDPTIRRQMDYFFLKPYSITDYKRPLMQKLKSFTPSGEDPHQLGFYDSIDDFGLQAWQPKPRDSARDKFSKTYEKIDITDKTDLMGEEEEEEEIETVECFRCGYEWEPRGEGDPARCPKCSSRRWDEEPGEEDE